MSSLQSVPEHPEAQDMHPESILSGVCTALGVLVSGREARHRVCLLICFPQASLF